MIYFIEAVGADLLKIGFTEQNPDERLKQLQTGCPHKLRLVGVFDEPASYEKLHHDQWQHLRTQGEWFRIDDQLRGYLWWLEFCKPYTDGQVNCAEGAAAQVSWEVASLTERIIGLEERNEFLRDQIERLWNAIGTMNGWPGGEQRPGDTLAVIPRPVSAREYADCRM